ncbi:MAG: tetratricopeptide repeat protein [Oligoflexales bacterium]|nr:tetratricopeptide repeat protein [Oligoflexales bacterium]
MVEKKPKLALVIGSLPSVDEIDQFQLIKDIYEINVISSESICAYLTKTSCFHDLTCIALPDYDENPSYLPGLEKALSDFSIVIVKERLGLFAYQALKAKWRYHFKLIVSIDNLLPYPANDIDQMRTVREEVTNSADAFIVQSEAALQTLELEGVDRDRIFHIVPWVEPKIANSGKLKGKARKALKLAEGDIVISYLGQIEWEEGLYDLLIGIKMAMRKSPSIERRIRLVISGIGSYSNHFNNEIKNLGLTDRVSYVMPERQATATILAASDAIYISTLPARDRIDGDPYRLLTAMANEVPVLGSRSPIIEELCGKHRIDFCSSSPSGISSAILKLEKAGTLVHDIVQKNSSDVASRFNMKLAKSSMISFLDNINVLSFKNEDAVIDHQIAEVENLVKNGQILNAVDMIEDLFKKQEIPLHHQALLHKLVADSFAKLGDYESAKESYNKSIDIDPYSSRAHIGLGTVSLVRDSYDSAIIHFQKAVSLAPDDEAANLGLGLAFQGLKELKEAMKWVKKSLEINPLNTAAIFTFVKLSHESEKYGEVEKILSRYLELKPDDNHIAYTLGGILYKQGRSLEVVTLMKKILDAEPDNMRAHALLKQAMGSLEQLDVSISKV